MHHPCVLWGNKFGDPKKPAACGFADDTRMKSGRTFRMGHPESSWYLGICKSVLQNKEQHKNVEINSPV